MIFDTETTEFVESWDLCMYEYEVKSHPDMDIDDLIDFSNIEDQDDYLDENGWILEETKYSTFGQLNITAIE